jgi:hypothetical protein
MSNQNSQPRNRTELELVLEFSPYDEDTRKEIIESSEAFFNFMSYLEEKYPNVRPEILESRMSMYMQTQMINNDEILEQLATGNTEIAGKIISQYAEMEGYENSEEIESSFNTMARLMGPQN